MIYKYKMTERKERREVTKQQLRMHSYMTAKNALVRLLFTGMFQGDLNVEKMRIEQHFQRLKEDKMHSLLDRLNAEERIRVDDMIDKQTREMLQLIDKKVSKRDR